MKYTHDVNKHVAPPSLSSYVESMMVLRQRGTKIMSATKQYQMEVNMNENIISKMNRTI